jgi:hypothetical protein
VGGPGFVIELRVPTLLFWKGVAFDLVLKTCINSGDREVQVA